MTETPTETTVPQGAAAGKHDGDYRAYVQLSRAWYANACKTPGTVDDVTFGLYSPGGGTSGEMSVQWRWLGQEASPKLTAWDDSWSALAQFHDVIDAMAEVDGQNPTPEQFCAILDRCGFSDQTPEVRQ